MFVFVRPVKFIAVSKYVLLGAIGVIALSLIGPAAAVGAESGPYYYEESPFDRTKLVPYVPTPPAVVAKMIELARVGKNDLVYDLGSGDGRIVIAAAKKGAKAIGFEIDGDLVKESRAKITTAGLHTRAEIRQQDILTVDLTPATVVTLYLFPDVNLQLRPKLRRQLKPGARIVSHAFSMGDWQADKVISVDRQKLYLWIIRGKNGISATMKH